MDRRCIHDGRRAVGGVRERRRDSHANVYGHARCYDADNGAAANTYIYPHATTHGYSHADASGSATSRACSCKSYGYGAYAYAHTNTYAYRYATTHGYAHARISKGRQGPHAPHDG